MGTIQIKRGLSQNLPSSAAIAEILYTTDTRKFYIGNGENTPLTEFANANQLADYLAQKANVLHSHASTDIDDFATAVDERIQLQRRAHLALSPRPGIFDHVRPVRTVYR